MPGYRLALDLRVAQDLGMSIGYQALGLNSVLVSKENVLDVMQLQNLGYQAAAQGLDEVVGRARQLGCTWKQIGLRFGLTQQGAQQRFGPRMGDNLGSADQEQTQ
jgi:hypothetical protein